MKIFHSESNEWMFDFFAFYLSGWLEQQTDFSNEYASVDVHITHCSLQKSLVDSKCYQRMTSLKTKGRGSLNLNKYGFLSKQTIPKSGQGDGSKLGLILLLKQKALKSNNAKFTLKVFMRPHSTKLSCWNLQNSCRDVSTFFSVH